MLLLLMLIGHETLTSDGVQVQQDLRDYNPCIHQNKHAQNNLKRTALEELNRFPSASVNNNGNHELIFKICALIIIYVFW